MATDLAQKPLCVLLAQQTVTLEQDADVLQALAPRFEVTRADSLDELQRALGESDFDLVLTVFNAFGTRGVDIIDEIRAIQPSTAVMFLAIDAEASLVAEAFRRGATDCIFLTQQQVEHLPTALSQSLERWRPDADIGMGARDLGFLLQLREAVSRAEDLDAALNTILRRVCERAGWRYGEVWWPEDGGQKLRWRAGHSENGEPVEKLRADVCEFAPEQDDSLVTRAWTTRRPVMIDDVQNSELFHRRATAVQLGLHGAVAVPVLDHDTPYAVLAFFAAESPRANQPVVGLIGGAASELGRVLDRKRVETELKRRKQWLNKTFASLEEAVFVVDEASRTIADCNQAAERMFGYSRDELLGHSTEFLHADHHAWQQFGDESQGVLDQRGVYEGQFEMRRRDGSIFPTEHTVTAISDDEGQRIAAVSVVRDITERREAERRLRDSEQKFRTLADNAPDIIARFDRDKRYLYVNSMIEKHTGKVPADFIGKTDEELGFPGEVCAVCRNAFNKVVKQQSASTLDYEFQTPDGLKYYQATLTPELDEHNEVQSVLVVSRDVTQQKRDEQTALKRQSELAHMQRLTAVGEMAASLAHELNQPIAAIQNYAHYCLEEARRLGGENGTLLEAAQGVVEENERATAIIRRLRDYLRKREPHRSTRHPNELMEEALALTASQLREQHVSVQRDLAGDLPHIYVDAIQIVQVLVNLITNAIDAMEQVPPDRRHLYVASRHVPDRQSIELTVADTGPGLSPETRQKVFDSFFTTKVEGLGAGLTISRSIIEAHGGSLWIADSTEDGATFKGRLPYGNG